MSRHPTPHLPTRRIALAAALAVSLAGLGTAAAQAPIKLRVGVTPGPHGQILEVVKTVAAKKGLDVQIVEFSDYVVPNQALDTGELELNSFQHLPYLENQVKDRGYKLVNAGFTVNFPLGIYSKKVKSWAEVPDGSKIAIQNDPTNGGRALLLFQEKGIIKLKPGVGYKPTVLDIVENPKKLQFIEIDAAQTPRSLDDVAAASINTNYATQAGLDPVKDPILKEDPKGPYANLIAVRAVDKDKPWVKDFVAAYQSDEVKAFIDKQFKGAVLTAW
ncbi:MetQ/NlpA family ABC transporter substrate-binding protein [Siculibacillus lacustris]|uniref:Lipoprotein n=1 Tax=Siculibacillus lacustris TaxID=1549641 RepID=A0A4Q9VY76_9HYPH|nr:MetQ/NlpA family ABC transporter substrate-binding protein [Siculibacillus lacustris]TBW40348.1 MetQ/NlpA family ABC transporter substrate-binding protein [Siculibacillus lacustris]